MRRYTIIEHIRCLSRVPYIASYRLRDTNWHVRLHAERAPDPLASRRQFLALALRLDWRLGN